MIQLYRDSMAIVLKHGKPDLFITFTCNPEWPEINESLLPKQKSWMRPDLIVTVFRLKLKRLIIDIRQKMIFGKPTGRIHVIEFQKRGLPHAHIIIILDKRHKIDTVTKINHCISAEIPDPEKNPKLYEKVTKYMIHRPCNVTKQPCQNKEGKCVKSFPKPLSKETVINNSTYPTYQRRSKFKTNWKNYTVGDEFVVPYNAYLLLKYDAHINVEVCSYFTAVKYLYKYVYKGYDRAIAEFCFDEIKKYLDTRFISSVEAFWRIKSNKLHDEYPNVIRLQFHPENQQNISFNEDDELEDIVHSTGVRRESQFTAWFKSNREHPKYRQLLYKDYPKYFVYKQQEKVWTKRSSDKPAEVVTRLYEPEIKNQELFWLRSVLNHIPGATSFKDLHTITTKQGEQIVCKSYYEVLKHLNVITDNKEWAKLLDDAILTMHSRLCRHLFAYLLCFCTLERPNKMWLEKRDKLCNDLLRKYDQKLTNEEIFSLGLNEINDILIENNTNLSFYEFENVPQQKIVNETLKKSKIEQKLLDHQNRLKSMTNEQQIIFEKIIQMTSKDETEEKLMFIDAPGGTGKSFVLNLAIQQCLNDGHNLIVAASSGIAALILKTGKTAHYSFKISLEVDEDSTCQFTGQSAVAEKIKQAKLIIWDEAPMSNKFTIEAVEKSIRSLMKKPDLMFGGKAVVFAGDFRQILPVVKFGKQEEAVSMSIKRSYIWPKMQTLNLTKNLRIKSQDQESQRYVDWLLQIGEGRIETDEANMIEVPEELFSKATSVEDFVKELLDDDLDFENKVILTLKNDEANQINQIVLEQLLKDEEKVIVKSIDEIISDEDNQFELPIEFVNSLQPSGMPPHILELKIGCIVMVLRNIFPGSGFCNGTRCKVVEIQPEWLILEIISGDFKGKQTAIPKIKLKSTVSNNSLFTFFRYQFPVKFAYCLTVNKSQGQTYEKVFIYFKDQTFSHGQLYVALSRCSNHKNIKIYSEEATKKLKNIVFSEIFE